MKKLLALVGVLALVAPSGAQERVSPEEAQRFARHFVEYGAKVENPQVKVDADPEKAAAVRHEKLAAMVIPDRGLSAGALNGSKGVVPVGQLWMRNLDLDVQGQPVADDKLRIVNVKVGNEDHPLLLFLLGVQAKPDDSLELLVYGKGEDPVLRVPMEKVDTQQDRPVELSAKRGDNDTGMLTLDLLGKGQATLTMTKKER